jgi:PAS domain S-box-containing protein
MSVSECSMAPVSPAGTGGVAVDKASLARAIEQAAEAVVITDPEGLIRYVNPAFTRMTGYTAQEAIGWNPRILKSGMQSRRYYGDMWRTIRDGQVWRGELVNRRKDGTFYFEEMSITPVRGADGATSSYIAIKQDVTGRRAAETQGRFLASIVESADDAIIGHTPDGMIVSWNQAAEEIHGYAASEVIGKHMDMLIAPESLGLVHDRLEGVRRGESLRQVDSVVLRKDGEKRDVQVSVCPIFGTTGEITAMAAIVRDVTRRKREQEALQDSERRFRTAFEQAPFGMCLSAADTRILRANKTFCQMLGYTEEELITLGWQAITHPEDYSISPENLARIAHGETHCADFEKRYVRKDGETVWARVRISSLGPVVSPAWQFITHVEDITEKKRARDSLRRTEEKYRRLLANLPVVAWSANQSGDPTYISPNVEGITGFTAARMCERGYWFGRIHPADQARVSAAAESLFAGERPLDEVYRFRREDGEWIWLHGRAVGTYTDEGAVYADGAFADVTEQRRAEDALAESEKRYRLLFERNLAGVLRALPGGRLLDCNEAFLGILGYDSSAELLSLRASDLLYNPAERDDLGKRLYGERRLTIQDICLKRKDGSPVWVTGNITLVEDEHARPSLIQVTAFDITDRKRAERALQASEQKYRDLITNIPDVLWTADGEGRLVFVSPNCESIFGFTPEEICDPVLREERIHPDDRRTVREAYAAFMDIGWPYNAEYRFSHKDGRTVWIQDRAFACYSREGRRYADGCARDVTNQKLDQMTIARLQRRTELILNSAGEGIMGLDGGGYPTFVNPAAAEMLGSTTDDLMSGASILAITGHSHAGGAGCPESECGLLVCLKDGKEHRGADIVFRSAAGNEFPVEYTSTPKFDDGQLVGAAVVFRDVTEARRASERIEASLREKEALLREIHHRVKNNLQIVCSLLKLNSRGLDDADARGVFEDMQHRVKAMALVHETLYRSGNLAGVDFSQYIPRLASQVLHAYGLSRAQLSPVVDVERAALPIDVAIPCALMLSELIANSAKHSLAAAGGGRLEIAFRRDGASWMLRVENSVCAAAQPATRKASSFGLELIRLLTEQLNGTLRIEPLPAFSVTVRFPFGEESNGGSSG